MGIGQQQMQTNSFYNQIQSYWPFKHKTKTRPVNELTPMTWAAPALAANIQRIPVPHPTSRTVFPLNRCLLCHMALRYVNVLTSSFNISCQSPKKMDLYKCLWTIISFIYFCLVIPHPTAQLVPITGRMGNKKKCLILHLEGKPKRGKHPQCRDWKPNQQ